MSLGQNKLLNMIALRASELSVLLAYILITNVGLGGYSASHDYRGTSRRRIFTFNECLSKFYSKGFAPEVAV